MSDFTGLLLAMPAYDGVKARTTLCLWNTARHCADIGMTIDLSVSSGNARVGAVRNNLLAGFGMMRDRFSHMLFVDSDLEWAAQDVPKMVARMESDGLEFVCGAYRKKWMDLDRVEYTVNFDQDRLDDPVQSMKTGLLRVWDATGGWMLMTQSVLARMMDAYPELKINADEAVPEAGWPYLYDFFGEMLTDGEKVSEDFSFSKRFRAAGGEIWMDPSIELHHWGEYCWRGNVADCLVAEPTATESSAA